MHCACPCSLLLNRRRADLDDESTRECGKAQADVTAARGAQSATHRDAILRAMMSSERKTSRSDDIEEEAERGGCSMREKQLSFALLVVLLFHFNVFSFVHTPSPGMLGVGGGTVGGDYEDLDTAGSNWMAITDPEMLKCTNLDGLIKKRGDVVEDEKTLWAQLGCEEKLKVRLSLHAKFMTDCKLTAVLSGALHHVAAKRRRDKRQVRASARKRGHRGGSGLGICLVLRKTPLEGLHVRLPLYCGVVGFLSAGQASDSAFDNNRCWNCTGCRRSRVPRKAQSKTG